MKMFHVQVRGWSIGENGVGMFAADYPEGGQTLGLSAGEGQFILWVAGKSDKAQNRLFYAVPENTEFTLEGKRWIGMVPGMDGQPWHIFESSKVIEKPKKPKKKYAVEPTSNAQ